MSNTEKDVPLAELRQKYLRKYPLERAKSDSERTPGYDSYYTRLRRTPIRLASDIVIFVSLMLFFLIITSSFASPTNGPAFTTYGSLAFLGKIASETQTLFNSLNRGDFNYYSSEILYAQLINHLVLLISTLSIIITSLVHFILAIVRFSKRQSLEFMHTVMNYYVEITTVIIIFAVFGTTNFSYIYDDGYKISGATSFGMVMLGIVLIGCSVALFISNAKNPKISKKLWIGNMVAGVFALLCIAILGTSRLGRGTYLFTNLLSTTSADFPAIIMMVIFVAFLNGCSCNRLWLSENNRSNENDNRKQSNE